VSGPTEFLNLSKHYISPSSAIKLNNGNILVTYWVSWNSSYYSSATTSSGGWYWVVNSSGTEVIAKTKLGAGTTQTASCCIESTLLTNNNILLRYGKKYKIIDQNGNDNKTESSYVSGSVHGEKRGQNFSDGKVFLPYSYWGDGFRSDRGGHFIIMNSSGTITTTQTQFSNYESYYSKATNIGANILLAHHHNSIGSKYSIINSSGSILVDSSTYSYSLNGSFPKTLSDGNILHFKDSKTYITDNSTDLNLVSTSSYDYTGNTGTSEPILLNDNNTLLMFTDNPTSTSNQQYGILFKIDNNNNILKNSSNLSVGTLSFVGAPISNGRAIIFYRQRISDTNEKGYFIIVE
jgi:hypothetical protein